jgi:ubiquinone/menaquinone biosynthesis C-methylase UbiE
MTDAPRTANPFAQGWTDEIAQRWLTIEDAMGRANAPFGDAALSLGRAKPGERVIDVGCGTGPTTRALAEAVGPKGHVLGVDIAGPLLARAREHLAGYPQVELLQADAQTHPFSADHDLVFSRFGVMFFSDTAAAFRNLGSALRPGGRLAVVCWRRFEENPWVTVTFSALQQVLPNAVGFAEGPGPFALGDPVSTWAMLDKAGFAEIGIEPFDTPYYFGPDLASAVHFATHSGPTGRALVDADQATRAAVRERIAAALSPHLSPGGVSLPGAAWLVHARR